jgi:hypothetical protein
MPQKGPAATLQNSITLTAAKGVAELVKARVLPKLCPYTTCGERLKCGGVDLCWPHQHIEEQNEDSYNGIAPHILIRSMA